jgi:hypothetical protein
MSDNSGQISVPGLPREIRAWLREPAEAELTSQAHSLGLLIGVLRTRSGEKCFAPLSTLAALSFVPE